MPIYHQYKVICIFVPKTGGTYLHQLLLKDKIKNLSDILFGWDVKKQIALSHATYQELSTLTNQFKDLDNYQRITFVRNPYARLVSEYNYNRKNKYLSYDLDFNVFVKNLHKYQSHWYLGRHLLPQTQYLIDHSGQICQQIQIYKMENFNQAIDEICKKLNILPLSIECKNKKINASIYTKTYQEYYSSESIQIVKDLYYDDFINFEYSLDLMLT